jgi:hypothetical protein
VRHLEECVNRGMIVENMLPGMEDVRITRELKFYINAEQNLYK